MIDPRLMNAIGSGKQKYNEFITGCTTAISEWADNTIFKRIATAEERGKKIIELHESLIPGPNNIDKLGMLKDYLDSIHGLKASIAGKAINVTWTDFD